MSDGQTAMLARRAKILPALSEGPFRDALEIARTATFAPEEWEAYERAKMAEQNARGALAGAHEEGVEEGHKSGLAEGKAGAILAVLATRGIAVDEAVRMRIIGCLDAAILDRWLIRAVTARSAEDVVASS